jgi:hypothetical protein
LGGVGEGLLLCGMSEQAGDELVGQLAEGQMDLGLQGREGSGIACQLFGPECLLGRQVGVNPFQGLSGSRDSRASLGVDADAHEKSFQVKPYLLE